MTNPGENCPECDKRLRADGRCRCGWAPVTQPTVPPPAYRVIERPSEPAGQHDADPTKCTVPLCRAPTCEAYVRAQILEGKRIAGSPAWASRFSSSRG